MNNGNQSQFENLSLSRTTTDLELMLFHHMGCFEKISRVCMSTRTCSLAVASFLSNASCWPCNFWYSSWSVSNPAASCLTSLSTSALFMLLLILMLMPMLVLESVVATGRPGSHMSFQDQVARNHCVVLYRRNRSFSSPRIRRRCRLAL